MCTALTYFDARSNPYVGRTLELEVLLPYALGYVPKGTAFSSTVPGKRPVEWTAEHGFIAVGAPRSAAAAGGGPSAEELLVFDGMNDAGLVANFNAYVYRGDDPTGGTAAEDTVLEGADLGAWLLSRFTTVADVRAAIAAQPVNPTSLPIVGGVPLPLHAMVTDASGAAITIEWNDDALHVYDNPVHVMTNAPSFPWHLTNLGNWTHLDNTDRRVTTFGALDANQPDSGIATAALPSSNTAVGRFVRAAYYTQYVAPVDDPDDAIAVLSHVINNFDRPVGATIDPPGAAGEGMAVDTGAGDEGPKTTSEYTTHTFMADCARTRYHVRAYTSMNWSSIDLTQLAGVAGPRTIAIDKLDPLGCDATLLLA